MESKNGANELVYKTETDPQTRKTNMATKGEREGEINQEFGMHIYTLLYIK